MGPCPRNSFPPGNEYRFGLGHGVMAESPFGVAANSGYISEPGQTAQSGEMTFAAALRDSIMSNIFVTLPTLSLSSMPKC
jgi:hypothetical protein